MLDWELEAPEHTCTLEDYKTAEARWCPGCGDHSVLATVHRLMRDEQLSQDHTVIVSGIGCSSRFPHYVNTYGFHGLHGRPIPIACGVRSRRPDLDVFVVTGDGDCCAIGTAHWIHGIRYNMNLTILLLDNNIYGLTKKQTSPTSRPGTKSNTHPRGSFFAPLNPIAVTLAIANASFVAQTIDWNPAHLYETIKAAHAHRGTSFVRVLQRCPHFMTDLFQPVQQDPDQVLVMKHASGIPVPAQTAKLLKNTIEHNPRDMAEARLIADRTDVYPIGLFYRNDELAGYDDVTALGIDMPAGEKLRALGAALDQFAI
jgi:2-oxoglutarate ferredoxin oxidoreductase subunit beta